MKGSPFITNACRRSSTRGHGSARLRTKRGEHQPAVSPVDGRATQRYCCVVIPAFDPETGNLPPGIHEASWAELTSTFGSTAWRLHLLSGLRAALDSLERAGCTRAFVDGSFVTSRERPADYDGCWDSAGVDLRRVDPVLLDFSNGRAAQKQKYFGELFVADQRLPGGVRFLEFFQKDKLTGGAKGIVALSLKGGLK